MCLQNLIQSPTSETMLSSAWNWPAAQHFAAQHDLKAAGTETKSLEHRPEIDLTNGWEKKPAKSLIRTGSKTLPMKTRSEETAQSLVCTFFSASTCFCTFTNSHSEKWPRNSFLLAGDVATSWPNDDATGTQNQPELLGYARQSQAIPMSSLIASMNLITSFFQYRILSLGSSKKAR